MTKKNGKSINSFVVWLVDGQIKAQRTLTKKKNQCWHKISFIKVDGLQSIKLPQNRFTQKIISKATAPARPIYAKSFQSPHM